MGFSIDPKVVTQGVEPTLLDSIRRASTTLPPGWNVVVTSGYRAGDPRFHGQGKAIDVQLIDPSGRALPNYQSPENFRAYEQFAQAVHANQQPGAPPIRWGGYFGGSPGQYGAIDLMHFDTGNVGTAGGSWEGGLTQGERAIIPAAYSVGVGGAQDYYKQALQAGYSPEQVFNAIFGQESNYGRNPRAGGNVLQIQPETFAQFAQPGENVNDRATNMAVGNRIIQKYMKDYNGDPARVAVAYFSGPGNVAPAGSPTPYKEDKADASGKTVSSYVSDVTGRLGIKPGQGGGQPSSDDSLAALLNTPPPPTSGLAEALGSAAQLPGEAGPQESGGLQATPSDYAPVQQVDASTIPATPKPEELAAPWAMHKQDRALKPLGDLFTLKTIGQPFSKQVEQKYGGGLTTRIG